MKKTTTVQIPEGMTAKDVRSVLHAGMQRRETLSKQGFNLLQSFRLLPTARDGSDCYAGVSE